MMAMSKKLRMGGLAVLGLAAMASGVQAAGDQPLWELGAAFHLPR